MKNSGSRKISQRYVSAIFAIAQQSSALVSVEKDLLMLADLIKENPNFHNFLHNPLLTRYAQATIMDVLLKHLKTNTLTEQFIALLAHHKRLNLLAEIITIFLEKTALERGEMAAELVVAKTISAKESDAIAQSLGKAYNKKINLNIREDVALLGGAIINIGSHQLDSSVAGKLNRLQQVLKAA